MGLVLFMTLKKNTTFLSSCQEVIPMRYAAAFCSIIKLLTIWDKKHYFVYDIYVV